MRELTFNEIEMVSGGTQATVDDLFEAVSADIITPLANFFIAIGGIYGGIQAIGAGYRASVAGVNAFNNYRAGLIEAGRSQSR